MICLEPPISWPSLSAIRKTASYVDLSSVIKVSSSVAKSQQNPMKNGTNGVDEGKCGYAPPCDLSKYVDRNGSTPNMKYAPSFEPKFELRYSVWLISPLTNRVLILFSEKDLTRQLWNKIKKFNFDYNIHFEKIVNAIHVVADSGTFSKKIDYSLCSYSEV